MWFCLSAPQDQKVKDGCHYDITHISPISIPYGDLICRARSTSRLSCLIWSHLLITAGKESEHWAANRGRNVFKKSFARFSMFFPSGLFPSGRPSLISWLFTESRDAWGLLEEKQTSIENICCRKFSTSLTPPSPHHCVSPSWSLKVCVDWRGWTSKLQEAEVTSTMSLQGLVTS